MRKRRPYRASHYNGRPRYAAPMDVVARYHEIALKGGNRAFFVARLVQNLKRAFADVPGASARPEEGRVTVSLPDDHPWEAARERIARVFGIANFSPMVALPRDIE